ITPSRTGCLDQLPRRREQRRILADPEYNGSWLSSARSTTGDTVCSSKDEDIRVVAGDTVTVRTLSPSASCRRSQHDAAFAHPAASAPSAAPAGPRPDNIFAPA